MDYLGFYINLDRSPQRKEEIEAQLARLHLLSQYSRFPAVDGNLLNLERSSLRAGEIGCFNSHYQLLEKNLTSTLYLHIMEDHVILSRALKPTLQLLFDSDLLDNFDIIFTDTFLPFDLFEIRAYKTLFNNVVEKDKSGRIILVKEYSVIDLKTRFVASMSSFLVHKNAIVKLHNLLHEEMKLGPRTPIDLFMRDKIHEGKISAGCIFPFITSIQLDHIFKTTIPNRYECNLSVLALLLLRHSFFIDCDWAKCNRLINDYFSPSVKEDLHHTVLSRVFDFVLSDRFRAF